jgi:fimbrial chaperone protein
MRSHHQTCLPGMLAACVAALLVPMLAHAGLFGISPIRLDLDRQAKTDSIAISNDDPERKLEIQTRLFEWTQDADGNDVYVESNDLVYFPRILAIEKQEQRVIRVGLKVPAVAKEKAYRLFVEELPPPADAEKKGAQILFLLRFGVPIFVRPEKEQLAAVIDRIDAAPGNAVVVVRNTGNQNFQIQSLVLRADAGFEKEIVGGYILAEATKRLGVAIPPDLCTKLNKIEIVMKTDRLGTMRRSFDWDAGRCSSK